MNKRYVFLTILIFTLLFNSISLAAGILPRTGNNRTVTDSVSAKAGQQADNKNTGAYSQDFGKTKAFGSQADDATNRGSSDGRVRFDAPGSSGATDSNHVTVTGFNVNPSNADASQVHMAGTTAEVVTWFSTNVLGRGAAEAANDANNVLNFLGLGNAGQVVTFGASEQGGVLTSDNKVNYDTMINLGATNDNGWFDAALRWAVTTQSGSGTQTPPPPSREPVITTTTNSWTDTFTHSDEHVDERAGKFDSGKSYNPTKELKSDHDPYITTSIYDTAKDFALFDVQKHIPTLENIEFAGTAQQALYDIEIATHKPSTWATATACSYAWFSETHTFVSSISYTTTSTYTDGVLTSTSTVETGRTYGTYIRDGYKASNKDISKKTNSKNLNDVPRSDIYPLAQSHVYAQQGGFTLNSTIGTDIKIPGLDASLCPGPANMGITCIKPASITTDYDRGSYTSESAAASAASAGLPDAVSKVTADLKQTVQDSIKCTTSHIKYEFCGLVVESDFDSNTTSITGTIEVPRASKEEEGLIPGTYPNGTYKGKGKFVYSGSANSFTFESNYGETNPVPNDVIVLAPVHDTTSITPGVNFIDQRINKNGPAVQLDSDFTLVVDVAGKHISDQGYNGNMDTSRWVDSVIIHMPFDVYEHNGEARTFVKGGTDIVKPASALSGSKLTLNFTVPVWNKEQKYEIKTEVKAINAEHGNGKRKEYNADVSQYYATNSVFADIFGKIYDLQVNNSTDPDWLNKVQGMDPTVARDYVIANELPFGRTQGASGQRSQNTATTYRYAPKLGYTFAFNFKTKGRKSNQIDVRVAENGFYFVAKQNGATAIPVDLYAKSKDGLTWIKLGATAGQNNLSVAINSTFLKVDPIETTNSNRIYPLEINKKYNYGLKVNIGSFAHLSMPHSLRLTYNNMNEYKTDGGLGLYKQTKSQIEANAKQQVATLGFNNSETGEDMVTGSVGRWYAGYALPGTTVAVPKNNSNPNTATSLPGTPYKGGYILVGMDFKTQDTSTGTPVDYLQYNGPRAINQTTKREEETNVPEKDWTKPFNPSNPDSYKEVTIQDVPSKVKVPNNIVAIFETDYSAQGDVTSVINN